MYVDVSRLIVIEIVENKLQTMNAKSPLKV